MAYEGAVGTTPSSAQISEINLQKKLNPREGNGVTQEDTEVQDQISLLATTQTLTSQVLGFLSRANNDTIVACLAGLVAITYLVLGRVGLILIGVIVGIVLHATWEEAINPQRNAHDGIHEIKKSKKEQGFALLERILDWRESKTSKSGLDGEVVPRENSSMVSSTDLYFSNFPPSIGVALDALTEAVIRDHIKYEDHRYTRFSVLMCVVGGIVLFCLWSFPSLQRAEQLL